MDFVEICNVYVGKVIIKAAKRISNSDEICHSYSDLNFGITFFGTQCMIKMACMLYFDLCMNIIFTSLMVQLVKYDVHKTHKIKSIHAIFYHILLFSL